MVKIEGRRLSQGISTINHRFGLRLLLEFFLIGKLPLIQWDIRVKVKGVNGKGIKIKDLDSRQRKVTVRTRWNV
jgi:hypothetical protein